MTFADLFKNSVLDKLHSGEISVAVIIATLLISAVFGLFIYFVYKFNTRSGFLSRSFNRSLAILPVITSAIMLAMGSNLAISLGMVGALSIVRFRNAVKDPADLTYLFWSISIGIVTGAGLFELALILLLFVALLVTVLDLIPSFRAPCLLVVCASDIGSEEQLMVKVKSFAKSHKVRSRSLSKSGVEWIIELQVKNEGELVSEVSKLEGVDSVHLMTHDGDVRFQCGVIDIDYRTENKYLVSDLDIKVLKSRLSAVMRPDVNQKGEYYEVRSIYFDDIRNSAMLDNDSGADNRSKYRIRTYYPGADELKLEIKEKERGFNKKTSCKITAEEFEKLIKCESDIPFGVRKPLNRLLLNMKCLKMQPKVIISYERTAFVYPSGNVRVTFDRNISVSKYINSFFDDNITLKVPVLPKGMHILEVKYDEFLPDIIAKQLEIGKLRQSAFSKYYLGRITLGDDHVSL